ncbi:MAG: hypothetical protein RLZZ306_2088 [Bacteroidota bacterium]|jgi:ketosteroid isomerase-like protein
MKNIIIALNWKVFLIKGAFWMLPHWGRGNRCLGGLLLLLSPFILFAQDPKQKEEIQKIIQNEKAFAQASIDKGTKNAFLEFLSKESMIFDKSMPANGLEYWQNIDFKGVMTWQPIIAEIAGSSDLGYTVGNYQFHNTTAEEKPSSFGSFVTLWKKQADNSWKAAIDMGIPHDEVIANTANITEIYPIFKPYELKNQMVLAERMVFMNDHFYWKNAKNSLNPFEPHLAQKVRIYHRNLKPIIGKENAKVFLKKTYNKSLIYTGLKAISSSAGDLVCVYGVISGGGKSGTYLRIYRQEAKDAWKIVVEMVDL